MGENFEDIERSYKHLWRERSIGAASKLAFMYLWELAKRRPARIVITLVDLGATYGRSSRAAKKWLDELKKAGLIDRVDHDQVRGRVEMDVLHPNPGQREPLPPDPQQRLPLTFPPPAETSDVTAQKRPTPVETSDVCAPKGRTFVHRLDVSAQERPTKPPDPIGKEGGETPTNGTIGTNEGKTPPRQRSNEQLGSNASIGTIGTSAPREPKSVCEVSCELLERRARAHAEYDAATAPAAQRDRLVRSLMHAAPNLDEWFAGYVAGQVLSGAIQEQDLRSIFQEMQRKRDAAAAGLTKPIDDPSRYLRFLLRKVRGWIEPIRRGPVHE